MTNREKIMKDAMEYPGIDEHIASMYYEVHGYIDEGNPCDCLLEISKAARLCELLGGSLTSRQVFATIVSPYIEHSDL
jgi:hypothetical protein